MATDPITEAIRAISVDPTGAAKRLIRRNLEHNTRKAITIKAQESPQTTWTPELVVSRMREDTDADVFTLFSLVGIDDAKLLELAREALQSIEQKKEKEQKRGKSLQPGMGGRISCFFNKKTKKWERR